MIFRGLAGVNILHFFSCRKSKQILDMCLSMRPVLGLSVFFRPVEQIIEELMPIFIFKHVFWQTPAYTICLLNILFSLLSHRNASNPPQLITSLA